VSSTVQPIILTRIEDRTEGGRVAYVTIDNPAKRNALAAEDRAAFAATMHELAQDAELRVVVVTGAGDKSFIGGANIGQMPEFPNPYVAAEGSRKTHLACDSVRRMPVPVIARINGYCLGTGMEIAACCDMRAASDNAMFGMPEVRHGIPSGMEACLLPRLIGWGKTMELVLTGMMIDAQEAYRCGFIERLVPMSRLDETVEDWVKALVTAGPRAVRIQKALAADWERMSYADAVQRGIDAIGRAHMTDEPRRLMKAFLERRKHRDRS
jgi:enoyl-CoA hydratase/carnithine racemase